MKKILSFFLCILLIFLTFTINVNAEECAFVPCVVDFEITSEIVESNVVDDNSRATGLIYSYSLYLTKTGTTLNITGQTNCFGDVVKCGFKDLTIQRRKASEDS